MSIFSAIPIRSNGTTIYAAWVNDIRAALISWMGSGVIPETQFTIADNISSLTDITSLIFDKTVVSCARVDYTIYRTNGSSIERREMGYLILTYKAVANAWTLTRKSEGDDDALNVAGSLSVVAATGQVQYKSDSIGATYVGKMRYKVALSFDKET